MRSVLAVGLVFLVMAGCTEEPSTGLDDTVPQGEEPTEALPDISDANNSGNPHFYWLPPVVLFPGYSGVPADDVSPVVEICLLDRDTMVCDPTAPILATFSMEDGPVFDRVYQGWRGNFWVTWRRSTFTPERDKSYRVSVKVEDLELGFFDVEIRRGGRWWNLTRNDGFIRVANRGPFLIGFRIEEGALEQAFCDAAGQGLEDCDVAQVDDATGGTLQLFEHPGSPDEATAAIIELPQNSATLEGEPIEEYVVIAELEDDGVTQGGAVPDEGQIPFLIDIRTEPPGIEFDLNGSGVQIVLCQELDFLEEYPEDLHFSLRPFLVFSDGSTVLPEDFTYGAPECEGHGGASHDHSHDRVGVLDRITGGIEDVARLFLPKPLLARRLHGGLNTTLYSTRKFESAGEGPEEVAGLNAAPVELDSEGFVVELGAVFDVDPATSVATVPDGEVGLETEILIQSLNGLGDSFPFGDAQVDVSVSGANAEAKVTVVDNEDGTYTATYVPTFGGQDQITISINGLEIAGNPYPSKVAGFGDVEISVMVDEEGTLDGVVLNLYDGGTSFVGSATSDENGQASFEKLPYGDYIVQAAEGYDVDVRFEAATQSITVDEPAEEVEFYASTHVLPAGVEVWRIADGGNGNAYRYVLGAGTWSAANAAARSASVLGNDGHLATLTSAEENTFANALKGTGDMRAWIGLTDTEVEGTFVWVTGEAFSFANWGGGEPNNGGGSDEDFVEIFASAVWNDIAGANGVNQGYLVEWEASDAYPLPPSID